MDQVAQKIVQSYADITRAANTTTYGVGEVYAASTTAAVASVFGRCSSQSSGQGGVIRSVSITSSNDQTTKLIADLFLFNAAPVTFGNDNEVFVPTDAEMLNCVAVVKLDGTVAGNSFTGLVAGVGNHITVVGGLFLPYECVVGDGSLYGVLVTRNAYAPISGEVSRIRLGIQQG
jgi:hypothetical protein